MSKFYIANIYPVYILLVLITLTYTGCSKDTFHNANDQETNSVIIMSQGRIVFPSQEAYNDHINWIFDNQTNEAIINDFYSDLGFISMGQIYEKAFQINDEEAFANYLGTYPNVFELVEYPDGTKSYECGGRKLHAYFANKDGIFQIGEKICRISYYAYYEIRNGDPNLISKLFEKPEKIVDNNIFVETINDETKRTQYYYATDYFDDDKKHRLVSRHYKTTIGYPRYYYLRTTAQKKGLFGIWTQENIDYVHLSWNQGYYCYYPGGYQNIVYASSFTYNNDSDVDILVQITDQDIDFSVSYLYTTHQGKRGTPIKTRSLDAL